MNINLILEQLKGLLSTKYKKLLAALAILAGACVFGALAGLTFRFAFSGFLWRLFGLFNGLPGKVALFLLAYQCAGKYKAEKNALHLAAAILLVVQGFSGFEMVTVWGLGAVIRMIPMPVALVLLCMDEMKSEDADEKMAAQLMMIVATGATVLQILAGICYFRVMIYGFPWFIAAVLLFVSNAALLAETAVLVLQVSKGEYSPVITKEHTAAAAAAAAGLAAKVTGKDKEEKSEPDSAAPVLPAEGEQIAAPAAPVAVESGEGDSNAALEKAINAALGQKLFVAGDAGNWEYKTVPGPAAVTVSKNEDYSHGVEAYGAIMQREAVGGWEFSHIQSVPVTKQVGCLAALLGQGNTTVFFNMLVFKRRK